MPRLLLVCALFAGGCFFDAEYRGVACSDGKCPSGLVCIANTCSEPRRDAAIDTPADVPVDAVDAQMAALTCADPGSFPATGGMAMGTTVPRQNLVTSTCGGFVMNGNDAVYRVTVGGGASLMVTIAGSFAVSAYVLAPCQVAPAQPTCVMNTAAMPGSPLSTSVTPGTYYIVVDATNPTANGTYTLTLAVN